MPSSAQMLPVLGTLLAVASASDMAMHRIPNGLVVGIAITGFLSALLADGVGGAGGSVLALLITVAVVWPAWAKGWVGGGDLKLASSAAAWLGLGLVPAYLVASALAVGVVSICCYAASARSARSEVLGNLATAARGAGFSAPLGSERGRVQVPAGLGFAVGALVTLAMTGRL